MGQLPMPPPSIWDKIFFGQSCKFGQFVNFSYPGSIFSGKNVFPPMLTELLRLWQRVDKWLDIKIGRHQLMIQSTSSSSDVWCGSRLLLLAVVGVSDDARNASDREMLATRRENSRGNESSSPELPVVGLTLLRPQMDIRRRTTRSCRCSLQTGAANRRRCCWCSCCWRRSSTFCISCSRILHISVSNCFIYAQSHQRTPLISHRCLK